MTTTPKSTSWSLNCARARACVCDRHARARTHPHTHTHNPHTHNTHTHAHTRTHTHKHTHAHRPHTHARPHVQLLMLRAACWVCGSRSTVGFLKSAVLCEVRDPGVWLWLVGWVSRAGGGRQKGVGMMQVVHVMRVFQRLEAESAWYFLWTASP